MTTHAVTYSRLARVGRTLPEAIQPVFVFHADGSAETPNGAELELIDDLMASTLGELGASLQRVRITGRRGAEYVFSNGPFAGIWYRRITEARSDQVN